MAFAETIGPNPGGNDMIAVAVVDDDRALRNALTALLEIEGYDVTSYADAEEALEGFEHGLPHLALIDLNMPGMDGMEAVRRIRSKWSFPVIMITANDDEIDEVLGLRLGADDYVRKPFSNRLLLERLRATLRRLRHEVRPKSVPSAVPERPQAPEGRLVRGPLVMEPERHAVSWRGQDVMLTVTEFQLLEALAARPGFVKTREQLMDVAYDDNIYVDDRTIDSHIKRLRKKLRCIDPEFSAIETLYGIGYRYSERSIAATAAE